MKDYVSISVLGGSGVGKTNMFGGIDQAFMSSNVGGTNKVVVKAIPSRYDPKFSIEGTEMSPLLCEEVMEKLDPRRNMAVQKDGVIRKAASGTTETTHFYMDYKFLSSFEKSSLTVKYQDYKGGLISYRGNGLVDEESRKERVEESKIIMNNLYESEICLLLIDGIKLAQYRNNDDMRKQMTGAFDINRIMNVVMDGERRGITIIVMITKTDSDMIPEDLKENNFEGLYKLALDTLDPIKDQSEYMAANYNWNFSIIPVTAIGKGNSVTKKIDGVETSVIKENANIKQENIDIAVLYGIKSALSERVKVLTNSIATCENQINRVRSKMGFFNTKAYRAEIDELESNKTKFLKMISQYMSIVSTIDKGFSHQMTAVRSVCQ